MPRLALKLELCTEIVNFIQNQAISNVIRIPQSQIHLAKNDVLK
jgi:hypothetical protein